MRKKLAQVKLPVRSRLAIFFAVSAILCATELLPPRPPVFSDYPFDQWVAAPDRSTIKWEVRLPPAELSVHQRLMSRIQAIVPGSELAKRRGRGELVLLARFEDSDGRQWRTGSRIFLEKIRPEVKSQELTFTLAAFVRPGDYKVQIALLDTQTMEHSFARRSLHVAAIKNDPLPDAWNGLPAVEVLPAVEGPDSWFLPAVKGLLHLPVRKGGAWAGDNKLAVNDLQTDAPFPGITAQPVVFAAKPSTPKRAIASAASPARVDLLVNTTPSEWSQAPAGSLRRNMAMVIPALKVLSGLNAILRPPSAAVIDLTHQRTDFETSNSASLDWDALGKVLAGTNPVIIDAKALAAQATMRDFFANEVARRAGDSGPARWLIVLSGPVMFQKQEDTPPPVLAPDARRHIVYMRFTPAFGFRPTPGTDAQIAPVQRIHGPMPGFSISGRGGRGRGSFDPLFPDDLERVLKPMGAQIVSVTSPEVFRKSVASLIDEISAAD